MLGANWGPALATPVGPTLPQGTPKPFILLSFAGTPHSPQPNWCNEFARPDATEKDAGMPGACVGLGSAKKPLPRFSRNWKKVFALKIFSSPRGPGAVINHHLFKTKPS